MDLGMVLRALSSFGASGKGLSARAGLGLLSGEAWVMLCWSFLEMVGTVVSGA